MHLLVVVEPVPTGNLLLVATVQEVKLQPQLQRALVPILVRACQGDEVILLPLLQSSQKSLTTKKVKRRRQRKKLERKRYLSLHTVLYLTDIALLLNQRGHHLEGPGNPKLQLIEIGLEGVNGIQIDIHEEKETGTGRDQERDVLVESISACTDWRRIPV